MTDNLVVDKLYTNVLNDSAGRARQEWELLEIVEVSNGKFTSGGWTNISGGGAAPFRPEPTYEDLGYRMMKLAFHGLTVTTDGAHMRGLYMRAGTLGLYTSGVYRWGSMRSYRTSTGSNGIDAQRSAVAGYFELITGLGNDAGAAYYGELIIPNPFNQREESTDQCSVMMFKGISYDNVGTYGVFTSRGGFKNDEGDLNIDGVEIFCNTGEFDGGQMYVYGSRTGSVPRVSKGA